MEPSPVINSDLLQSLSAWLEVGNLQVDIATMGSVSLKKFCRVLAATIIVASIPVQAAHVAL